MTNVRKGGKGCETYKVYLSQVYELPMNKGPRDILNRSGTGCAKADDSFQEDMHNILLVENCNLTNEIKQLKANVSEFDSKVGKLEIENKKLMQRNDRKEHKKNRTQACYRGQVQTV
jgi:hypothetical protein